MTTQLELTLTNAAVTHIKNQLCRRGTGVGLKIGTKSTGCSGLAYTLEFIDNVSEGVPHLVIGGVSVVTDEKTALILRGATLDYVKEGLGGGLTFTNPNERDRCGCGESFRV